MYDPLIISLFPKLQPTPINTTKNNKITKDLFTKKLGYKVNFEFNSFRNKNNQNFKRPNFFKNISTFPKNYSNSSIFKSFNKENNLSKISFSSNKPSFSNGTKRGNENNKQIGNIPFDYTFSVISTKNKKDIKKFLENNGDNNNKDNKNINNKFNKSRTDVNITHNNKSENLCDNKDKEKILTFEHVNIFKDNNNNKNDNNDISKIISDNAKNNNSGNCGKNLNNKNINHNSKNNDTKKTRDKSSNSNKNNINKKNKGKDENNKGSIESNKSLSKRTSKNIDQKNDKIKKENKSKILIKSFYEDFIDIVNLFESYKEYTTAINNFNETYFYLFKINSFPSNINLNKKFLETYKYSSILIICLIFLSKDESLFKENTLKIKELLLQYIYTSINLIDYKTLDSSKINFFIEKNKLMNQNTNATLIDKLNEIINLLFLEKMNEYKKIRKCLKQLANNIDILSYKQIFYLLNKSILFCHNCQYLANDEEEKEERNKNREKTEIIKTESSIKTEIINTNNNEENKDNNIDYEDKKFKIYNKDNNEDNSYSNENTIKPPFIKEKMTKKFCLILDLDETIIHNMNLPFGDYFFVRPGFFELIKKVKENYEIIIFTEKDKKFVDDIMNKIDYDKYINYTLYKNHVIYEEKQPIKKLELIGRNLDKIIYVDDSDISAKYNKRNLYKISSWYNDIFDNELITLKEKLVNIATSEKFNEDITQAINN